MPSEYVVLRVHNTGPPETTIMPSYNIAHEGIEALTSERACRFVADAMSDKELAEGVTLIAVPARNWASGQNTYKAETQRKLRRS